MADETTPEAKGKPIFDEQTLAKLLEAAYVLQEHNRDLAKMELRPRPAEPGESATGEHEQKAAAGTPAKDDYTGILAHIVETQHQIQVRHLALDPAMALIVQRIVEIAKAAGASIGILDGRNLRYRASAGFRTLPAGTDVLLEKALCAASLRVGDVIRCADVNPEFLIDAAECKRRGIQSLICVPIYHDGKTAGGLEVYYSKTNAFTERDVHTCQLMAGLVTEALARNEGLTSKSSTAVERAVMLDAIEKLQPNLAALVDAKSVDSKSAKEAAPSAPPVVAAATLPPPAPPVACRKCGHELIADEQFCGQCGSPRSGNYEAPSMQSKVASMLSMQESARKNANGSGANGSSASHDRNKSEAGSFNSPSGSSLADAVENELPELFRLPEPGSTKTSDSDSRPILQKIDLQKGDLQETDLQSRDQSTNDVTHPDLAVLPADEEAQENLESEPETALVKTGSSTPWGSAAAAREFLERVAGNKQSGSGALARFLLARRGDVYLVLALLLVAGAIRWGIWSNHSVSATGNAASATHRRPDADLPFFDWVLVKFGLAEAPDAPQDKGNPDTQVWVDLHTGLYYCQNTDLYGKTPKGKYETQKDAQLDQFESASRKPCP
jgi:putative methionine-R-sulfoxide reductase with GAF domain